MLTWRAEVSERRQWHTVFWNESLADECLLKILRLRAPVRKTHARESPGHFAQDDKYFLAFYSDLR